MLKLEQQILFTEISNPSFSNKFVFNQWLPYFSLSSSPYACNLRRMAWLLSFIASQLYRSVESLHISLCNDGIYIFCHLVSEMKQRPSKVLEDFFLLDTGSQNNGCCLFTRAAAYARMFTVILFGYNDNFLY